MKSSGPRDIGRRRLLRQTLAAGMLATGAAAPFGMRLALAGSGGDAAGDARFILVILRGALDGLSAVPPVGDPAYASLRREIAVPRPGDAAGALALDGTFGLHPSLRFMGEAWQARQLTVLHAIATPYRERSHFDGQDVLESGFSRAHAAQSGWLNRALAGLPQGARNGTAGAVTAAGRELGVALGANIPLVMRGPAEVASWSSSRLRVLDEDTLQRIGDLYSQDPLLARRLADALASDSIAKDAIAKDATAKDTMVPDAQRGGVAMAESGTQAFAQDIERARRQGAAQNREIVNAAAGFLKRPDGPRVAVFDTTGWDTHANEGAGQGQLAYRLAALDAGLRTLRDQLGPVWDRTAMFIATEFGRTAAINGTRGTDHGTGAAAFLLGGAVRGGRVLADWPGLAPAQLHEGRDLRPTADLRSVMKSLLRDHLGVPRRHIDSEVFPDSAGARYLDGLV